MLTSASIERWKPEPAHLEEDIESLAGVLHACVAAGASVSFVLPFGHADAKAFWRDQVPSVEAKSRCVLLARLDGRIAGTVQLDLATPPNQPHRAEVRKLLVHPDVRGRGLARQLMTDLERYAIEERRTLLTLDTVTGGPAERLYRSLGYVEAGRIPGYAFNFESRILESTTVMYKQLRP